MYNYYSFGEKIKNLKSLIYTKIFWRKARLIRLPVYARNKKNIIYKRGFTVGYNLRIEASHHHPSIRIGSNVIIGDYCHIVGHEKVIIGDNTLIASKVFISDTSHGVYKGAESSNPMTKPNERKLSYQSVEIGKNVWIGENVSILQGVKIGDGCIIGANSILTKSFPSNCIIAGNPAIIIKRFNKKNNVWEKINKKGENLCK